MDATLRICEGTVGDADTIVRHRRFMFEEMGFTDSSRNDEMDSSVRAELRGAIPSGAVIAGAGLSVGRLLGKPFNPSGAYAYLMSLYAEPPFRHMGIATRLVELMIDWARREGLVEVKLHASVGGRPLYEQLGFRQTNEMRLPLR